MLSQTKHKRSAPEQQVQASAVCLYMRHTGYIPKQTVSVWIRHLITQGLLGGSGWGYSSPNPHQLPSKRAQSICLFLGVPPNYSLNRSWLGLLEKQQYVCFFYLRDLSQMKDVTMTGPLWLVNKSYPEDLAWNKATSRCGLPPPPPPPPPSPPPIPFTVLNGEHSDEWDLIYSPRWGVGRGTEDSYSFIYLTNNCWPSQLFAWTL